MSDHATITARGSLNADQRVLSNWIEAGLHVTGVREGKGDAKYLLGNMIAKFSLFAEEYPLSVKAAARMIEYKVDLAVTYKRGRFYGKKSPFIYEHSIPAAITLDHLLQIPEEDVDARVVEGVLQSSGKVCVILRDEDRLLVMSGLGNRMPEGWSWGGPSFARYECVGIRLSNHGLRVQGSVKR